jgi:hypothetical protein
MKLMTKFKKMIYNFQINEFIILFRKTNNRNKFNKINIES